jgi:hypothetical protein
MTGGQAALMTILVIGGDREEGDRVEIGGRWYEIGQSRGEWFLTCAYGVRAAEYGELLKELPSGNFEAACAG